jgi:hypothetical protein
MIEQLESFVERRLPIILSLLAHTVLFLYLWMTFERRPAPPERMRPIQMHVVRPTENVAEAAPAPAPVAAIQRTSPNPTEEETDKPPVEEQGEPDELEVKPIAPQPTPVPDTVREEKVARTTLDQDLLEKFRADLEQDEREHRLRKSKIMVEVAEEAAKSPGLERPFASDGLAKGIVRRIDIASYPHDVQQRFMRRYGIVVRQKFVPAGKRQSFVNAVSTERGTYENRGSSGYYEVMTLSKQVLRRMAELEQEELLKRNLIPERSQLREIVFGLREIDGQVDLVVTRFSAVPIE